MTRRLIVALTSAMTVFWLCAAALGIFVMEDEFSEVFDSTLKETAERLLTLAVDDLSDEETLSTPRRIELQTAKGEQYLVYQARDATGKVLLHSHDIAPTPFDAPLKVGKKVRVG